MFTILLLSFVSHADPSADEQTCLKALSKTAFLERTEPQRYGSYRAAKEAEKFKRPIVSEFGIPLQSYAWDGEKIWKVSKADAEQIARGDFRVKADRLTPSPESVVWPRGNESKISTAKANEVYKGFIKEAFNNLQKTFGTPSADGIRKINRQLREQVMRQCSTVSVRARSNGQMGPEIPISQIVSKEFGNQTGATAPKPVSGSATPSGI